MFKTNELGTSHNPLVLLDSQYKTQYLNNRKKEKKLTYDKMEKIN